MKQQAKQDALNVSRRDFLRAALSSGAGAALLSTACALDPNKVLASEIASQASSLPSQNPKAPLDSNHSVGLSADHRHYGGWSADGSWAASVPESKHSNASSDDGSYRVLNSQCFPADDASPIPPLPVPDSWDKSCDIVVVGAGGGGLNAAARCAELGAHTICVEAMDMWGGNAQSAGMCGILGGSKMQDKLKFALPSWPYSAKKMVDYALPQYHYAMDPELLYLIADQAGKSIDWMAECGVEWRLGEVPVYVAPKNSTLDHHVLKMKDATDAMYKFACDKGCEFIFRAPAAALVQNKEGRIVGVACDTPSGRMLIEAKKAVILTAGGFCNNKALLEKYCPTAAMACASNYLVGEEKGACTRMGLGVGADISGFNSSASFDGGVDWQAEGHSWAHFLYDGMTQLSRQPWLTIDRTGARVPYIDSNVKKTGADAIYALGDLATCQMMRPGHRSYIIFDSHFQEYLGEFAQEHCRMFLTPGLAQEDKIPPKYRDWRNGVKDALDADVLKKRNSLEELEADMGFEKGVLCNAVKRWNELCDKGEDDYIYPMPKEWLFPIKDAPFYACRIGGNLYGTKAGLLINNKMQVVSTKGTIIPGLYAGWHTAGGACGENSYVGQPILGSIMGDVGLAFCGGFVCGTKAYEEEIAEIPENLRW